MCDYERLDVKGHLGYDGFSCAEAREDLDKDIGSDFCSLETAQFVCPVTCGVCPEGIIQKNFSPDFPTCKIFYLPVFQSSFGFLAYLLKS